MFNTTGKKNYKVLFINGGVSANNREYTFLTVEAKPEGNAKYGDKLKVNVWGIDLTKTITNQDYIKILGATEVGIVRRKDKNSDKWYENLTITCNEADIVLGEAPAKKEESAEQQVMQPIEFETELPF